VVAGWKPSTQFPAPSQESFASQTSPFEVPMQAVVLGWNPSAGQAPESPVQLSATSHCPADSRHVVVRGWNPSTQFPAPSQESVPSQRPPFELPSHGCVDDAGLGWHTPFASQTSGSSQSVSV
jgi:hypothetical protein